METELFMAWELRRCSFFVENSPLELYRHSFAARFSDSNKDWTAFCTEFRD
jgi:hypothetical protein